MKNNKKSREQKAGCHAANNSYDWTIPCQADTHTHTSANWQPLIIGNPNYNGFQWLLKLLIITANNYSMPNLPWQGGWSNYTPSQSVTSSYSQCRLFDRKKNSICQIFSPARGHSVTQSVRRLMSGLSSSGQITCQLKLHYGIVTSGQTSPRTYQQLKGVLLILNYCKFWKLGDTRHTNKTI